MRGTAAGLFVISFAALIIASVLVGLVVTKRAAIMDVKTTVADNQTHIMHVETLILETRREHTERLAAQVRIAEAAEKTASAIAQVILGVAKTARDTQITALETKRIAKIAERQQNKIIDLLERED
jgi:N-methylhydantoinase B/oxoprolinase/acetone carboxylase alpha subunit